MGYRVLVDDNFHYHDESERYELGEYNTLREAIYACVMLVDEFLRESYQPGMTADQLLEQFAYYGCDPFVATGDGTVPFSARDFASQRVHEICAVPESPG